MNKKFQTFQQIYNFSTENPIHQASCIIDSMSMNIAVLGLNFNSISLVAIIFGSEFARLLNYALSATKGIGIPIFLICLLMMTLNLL